MESQNIATLKIHKLTQAQYERELAAGNIEENALYLTPDEEFIETDPTVPAWAKEPILNLQNAIIPSSTEGSTKKFKLVVNDDGIISAVEIN